MNETFYITQIKMIVMMFTRLSHFNNRQFFIRLFWHWIAVFILLLLAAWLPFLLFDITQLPQTNGSSGGEMVIAGIPSVFIASILVALLHTRQDRKRNYPKIYWHIWLIPTFILFDINITAYAYYHHYTYTMYKQERFRLEQRIKENNHPDYASLADYYKNGRGGPKDLPKAQELYKKACPTKNGLPCKDNNPL